MAKLFTYIVILSMLLIVTGCWDRVEIEERGFVIGAAIDITDGNKNEQSHGDLSNGGRKENYKLTYQFVVPGSFQGKGGGRSNGGVTGEKPYFNLTSEGKTIFQISRQMSNKIGRSPYLEHIKIMILSEELSKKGYLYDALDIFVRDHEMRRVAKVMITEGEAMNSLNVNARNEKLPIMFLESISENIQKTSSLVPPTNIGDLHSYLLKGTSFVVPRLVVDEYEANIIGAAIINSQDQKMVGTLNENETLGLNFITGEVKSAVLEFLMKDQYFAVEVKEAKSKITANDLVNNQMKFTIEINAEGNVGESYGNLDLLNPKVLSEIEEKSIKEIELLSNQVIEKLQKEYKTDVIGIGDNLKQEHYRTWETVKKDWDKGENYFSQCVIDVKVKFKIREIGASIETVK